MPVMNGLEMMAAYHEYLISSSSSSLKISFFVGSSATDSLLGKETLRENGNFMIMIISITISIIIFNITIDIIISTICYNMLIINK